MPSDRDLAYRSDSQASNPGIKSRPPHQIVAKMVFDVLLPHDLRNSHG